MGNSTFYFGIFLALIICAMQALVVHGQATGNTITVTSNEDNTAAGDKKCTLREAIINANNNLDSTQGDCAAGSSTGTDQIEFDISGASNGEVIISPTSGLPSITDPVEIDGSYDNLLATPIPSRIYRYCLDGSLAGTGMTGLILSSGSDGSTIQGLMIRNFDKYGIAIRKTKDHRIVCNFIGMGTSADGDTDQGNKMGIVVFASRNITIGGPNPGDGNLISGNQEDGIQFTRGGQDEEHSDHLIQGNYIGTDSDGTNALPNGYGGITIFGGVKNVTIGGTATGAGNLISGNKVYGVMVTYNSLGESSETSGHVIQGNRIGTTANGTAALVNTKNGIEIRGEKTRDITVGGTAPGAGNVIAHDQRGVVISGGATAIAIWGNRIGTTANGTAIQANGGNGIEIKGDKTRDITIGGTAPGAGNIIAYNLRGVVISGGATAIAIWGNRIGTTANGTAIQANGGNGIEIKGDKTRDITIGGTAPGAGNIIAYNLRGVVVSDGATAIAIRGNAIYENKNLGIALNYEGVTANDTDDADTGVNNLQNFPVITTAVAAGRSPLWVTYSVNTAATNATYPLSIDFYIADADDQEGKTYLGTDTYTETQAQTSVTSNFTPLASVSAGDKILATATDADGNTSEFSAAIQATCSFVVTTTSDAGIGSLRQAIACANDHHGSDDITFNLTNGTGPYVITPKTALPVITDPLVLDGSSQPGAESISTTSIPERPAYQIVLDGNGASAHGLSLHQGSDGSTIKGLNIRNFSGAGIEINSSADNIITGNFIGTDETGNTSGTNLYGVVIVNATATNNTIGGTAAGEGNLISGNTKEGIDIESFASQNHIRGNFIGTKANGNEALANGEGGVVLDNASNNTIGGTATGAGNLICGNTMVGIGFIGDASNNLVQGNRVGINIKDNGLGNSLSGIYILGASDNTIGGTATGEGNTIAHNGGDGITVSPWTFQKVSYEATGNALQGNTIYSNTGLGIDLRPDSNTPGVTVNDTDDTDAGPNNFQNFPVLTSAQHYRTSLTVAYKVDATATNAKYPLSIDFYLADADDQEGKTYLGSDIYTAPQAQTSASTIFTTAAAVSANDKIVAIATDADGNTSEFSTVLKVSTLTDLDLGDAPNGYPTLLADDGARHKVSTVYLGTSIDVDDDGQQSATSDGDDINGTDDEDGVTFGTLTVGKSGNATVEATASGYLDAWIDFDQDGDWDDTGEHILDDEPLTSGSNTVTFTVPNSAKTGSVNTRFRFASSTIAGYTGLAEDGEVEDYQVTVVPPDVTAPKVVKFFPANGAADVAIDADLVLTFDEEVYAQSGNITIYDDDNTPIETIDVTSNQVSGSGTTTITINPSSDLAGSTGYYVLVDASAFEDASNNPFAGISDEDIWNFTTEDITAPRVVTLSPANGAANVVIDADLVLTFDEEVYTQSGNITIYDDDNTPIETIDVTGNQVTGSGTSTITINPSSDLTESTGYYVLVDASAFEDASNNPFTGISDEDVWNFTTEDITAPKVVTLSPANGAANVAIDANLVITFDEEVYAQSGNITIYDDDNTPIETIDVTGNQVSGSGTTTITINPSSDLAGSTGYYVLVDASAFEDASNNPFTGISDKAIWNFTTEDITAPKVVTLFPANGAANVVIDTDLVLTFDEEVYTQNGNITIYDDGNTPIEAIDVTGNQVTGSGTTTITINPSSDLAGSTGYYVLVDASAFDDASSNSFTGIGDKATWNFTTKDITAPKVVTLSPANGAANVAIDADLVLTFDEEVYTQKGNITIYRDDDTPIEAIDVTGNQVSGPGTTTITIDPSSDLTESSGYYVLVDASAFEDASNNPFTGISDKAIWNFTTEDITAPKVVTLSPANGAANVAIDADLVLTFDEEVYTQKGNITIYDYDDTPIETIDVTSNQVSGSGTTTITINPSPDLTESTGYYVLVDASVFDDASSNSFTGISDKATWNFTTADTTPPVITLLGDNPLYLHVGDSYTDPGATASDNMDGDISTNITVGGDMVDTSMAETYTVTYDVRDAAGNAAIQVKRDVVVRELITGLEPGIAGNEEMVLYPNPTKEQVRVRFEGPVEARLITVFDKQGRLARSYKVEEVKRGEEYVLDLHFFRSGVYFIQAIDDQGRKFRRRLVIVR